MMRVRVAADPAALSGHVESDRGVIPYEFKDAVELWARQWGRHGTISWNPVLRCAVVELTLKPDDPRLRAWQEGKLSYEPKEQIPLHYQPRNAKGEAATHYVGIPLTELGVDGVLEILNRGNTSSGRGEFESILEAVRFVGDRNDRLKHQVKAAAMDNSRQRAKDMRRQILGLPSVNVPVQVENNG